MKVDDDISLDLAALQSLLAAKYPASSSVPDIIECPSVMRNMRPWRQTHNKVMFFAWPLYTAAKCQ